MHSVKQPRIAGYTMEYIIREKASTIPVQSEKQNCEKQNSSFSSLEKLEKVMFSSFSSQNLKNDPNSSFSSFSSFSSQSGHPA